MSYKEEAIKLVDSFSDIEVEYVYDGSIQSIYLKLPTAKKCALIAVGKILSALQKCWDEEKAYDEYLFYQLVKIELEAL